MSCEVVIHGRRTVYRAQICDHCGGCVNWMEIPYQELDRAMLVDCLCEGAELRVTQLCSRARRRMRSLAQREPVVVLS